MVDPNDLTLPELFVALTDGGDLRRLLERMRGEDLGSGGDVTTGSIIEPGRSASGRLVARRGGVVAGLDAVTPLLEAFQAGCTFAAALQDGDVCAPGSALGRIEGSLRAILAVERSMLNLVGRLSGVATSARRYVDAVAGSGAVICDTRKTTPGLRALEKYAVRCGGATLHRQRLDQAALYKDNHLAHVPPSSLGRVLAEAVRRVRQGGDLLFVEVEVDTHEQLESVLAIEAGLIDIVLLDNMTPPELRRAVALRDARAPGVLLEASGQVTLENVAQVAATGVDRIAVGALTHSAASLDVSLEMSS